MNLVGKAQNFLGSLGTPFGHAKPDVAAGMRDLLNDAMPVCPECKQRMEGHHYQHVASTPLGVGKDDRFDAMMKAVRDHRWDELAGFQEWEATSPDADVYLFRCPDGRYVLAVIYCPFELGDIYKLVHQERIGADELPTQGGAWVQV